MRHSACQAALLAVLLSSWGCSATIAPWTKWPGFAPANEAPGTAGWWTRNRSRAEFVPGHGLRVEGVPGYFDDEGRPIQDIAPVSFEEEPDGMAASLDPRVTIEKVKTALGRGPNQAAAERLFHEGEAYYQQQQYALAASKFEQAAARAEVSGLRQDALFMYADSLFFDDEYPKANDAYGVLIEEFPSTKYLDRAVARQSDMARYWHELHKKNPHWLLYPNFTDKTRPRFDTLGHALRTYDNIRMNDPTGPLADDALMATANAYFIRNRWEDADYHYELLRRDYPKSPHQLNAHLLGLQCKLRKYQGPDYDEAPLDEGRNLIKQLRIQFPGEIPDEERQRLVEIEAQIARHRALRAWRSAEFYEQLEYYRAARFYYSELARKFPDTELAARARERVSKLQGEPEVPQEKLGWIMRWVPESRTRAAIATAKEESNQR